MLYFSAEPDPAIIIHGLRIHVGCPDAEGTNPCVVNATVHVANSSHSVNGIGLWKMSVYGGLNDQGEGGRSQNNENILSAQQQNQPYTSGSSTLVFTRAQANIALGSLGCGRYKYLCIDFQKGDNPQPDYNFMSIQPRNHKYTYCHLIGVSPR